MKTTTITRYETSDGASFQSREKAQIHELNLFFADASGPDVKITGAQMLRVMLDKPKEFSDLLMRLTHDDEE